MLQFKCFGIITAHSLIALYEKKNCFLLRSPIHGRGLFCKRTIDAGEMVIEYSGNVIRSTLTDKREKYYDGKVRSRFTFFFFFYVFIGFISQIIIHRYLTIFFHCRESVATCSV